VVVVGQVVQEVQPTHPGLGRGPDDRRRHGSRLALALNDGASRQRRRGRGGGREHGSLLLSV
jgi:hypothetical protein